MNKDSALDLDGTKVCVQTGTTTELNLADHFRTNKMKYETVGSVTADEAIKSYDCESLQRLQRGRLAALRDPAFAGQA